jgi:hypothetical protein
MDAFRRFFRYVESVSSPICISLDNKERLAKGMLVGNPANMNSNFQRVMAHIFRDTLYNMRTGVIGMDDLFSVTAYIPMSGNLRTNII